MPSGWSSLITIVHSFEFWVALSLLAIGIIIQKLIRPYFHKIAEAFHRLVFHARRLHDAHIDPTQKPDEKGRYPLYSRHHMVTRMDTAGTKLDAIIEILNTKACMEACPAFKAIAQSLISREQTEQEFLQSLLDLRRQTQEDLGSMRDSTSELHRRIDSFLENYAVVSEKKDDLIARLVTALEGERARGVNGSK
jgi:hypothetical protein